MRRSFALCACLVSFLLTASIAAQQVDPFGVLAALPATPPVERGVRVAVRDLQGQPVRDAVLVVVPTSGAEYSAAWTAATAAHPGDSITQLAHVCATAGGQRFALDERGGAQLPRVGGYALAWRHGTFAGDATDRDRRHADRVEQSQQTLRRLARGGRYTRRWLDGQRSPRVHPTGAARSGPAGKPGSCQVHLVVASVLAGSQG